LREGKDGDGGEESIPTAILTEVCWHAWLVASRHPSVITYTPTAAVVGVHVKFWVTVVFPVALPVTTEPVGREEEVMVRLPLAVYAVQLKAMGFPAMTERLEPSVGLRK
jgi:hypothetical protein